MKYSHLHIVAKALKECMHLFKYSDATLCLWITSVRIDYSNRNVAHSGPNTYTPNAAAVHTLNAASVHEDLYKSLNSLHLKYDQVIIFIHLIIIL